MLKFFLSLLFPVSSTDTLEASVTRSIGRASGIIESRQARAAASADAAIKLLVVSSDESKEAARVAAIRDRLSAVLNTEQ